MGTLTYAVTTNTGRVIRARWTGKCIELVVFGANMMTDCQVEWHYNFDKAVHRFQWLVERNTKPVVDKSKLTFLESH